MVKKRVKKVNKKVKSSNGVKDFFMNKYFVSAVFILVIVGGFFLISTLSQNEEAIAGEAYRRSITSKSPEPFFQLYKEYKTFHEMSGEGKITFKKFDDALIRSNVFLIDSRRDYRNERAELKNSYSSIRKLVNKVYAGASSDTISLTAWYMVFEDRWKTETFGRTFDKPINPTFFRKLSKLRSGETIIVEKEIKRSSRNSLTGAAAVGGNSGGTAFSDCAEGDNPKASGGLVGTSVDPTGPTGTGSSGQPTPYSEGGNGDACGNLDPNKVGFGSSSTDPFDDLQDEAKKFAEQTGEDGYAEQTGGEESAEQTGVETEQTGEGGLAEQTGGETEQTGSGDSGGSGMFREMEQKEEEHKGEEGTWQEIYSSDSGGGSSQKIGDGTGDDCGGAGSNAGSTLMDCAGGDEDGCDEDDIAPAGMGDQNYGDSGCGGGGADPAMVQADITQSHISGYNPMDSASMDKLGLSTFGGELFIMFPK